MSNAKKLPSGNFRVRAYAYTDESGKKIYRSFTARTKSEAEFLASQFLLNKKNSVLKGPTFKQALDSYITNCESICSPATIRGYRSMQKREYDLINDLYVSEITSSDVQKIITARSKKVAPKTIRNIIALVTAVMNAERPDLKLNLKLPAKVKPDYIVPTDEDIINLINSVDNDDLLNCILLAAFGSLRRSEICGLHSDAVFDDYIIIKSSHVYDQNNNIVERSNMKNYTSKRIVQLPECVMQRIQPIDGYITSLKPDDITRKFIRHLKKEGIPPFRFHDLRHYSATIMHALNFPSKYAQSRGGWKSSKTLEEIYTHTLDKKTANLNKKLNKHFEKVFDKTKTSSV